MATPIPGYSPRGWREGPNNARLARSNSGRLESEIDKMLDRLKEGIAQEDKASDAPLSPARLATCGCLWQAL
jgi:hypothetical protein